jgi:hypothetical protein
MNNQQIFHIAGEIIVISGVTIFLTNKIKKLENELKNVTEQMNNRQKIYENHLEHITGILDAIINEKQLKQINEVQLKQNNEIQLKQNNENNLTFFNDVLDSVETIVTQTKEVINNIPSSVSITLNMTENEHTLNLNTNSEDEVKIQEIDEDNEDNLDEEIQSLLKNNKEKEINVVFNNVEIPVLQLSEVNIDQSELYDTSNEQPVEFVEKVEKKKGKAKNEKIKMKK